MPDLSQALPDFKEDLETIAAALITMPDDDPKAEAAKQALRNIWDALGLPRPPPC